MLFLPSRQSASSSSRYADHDNGCVDSGSRIRYRLVCDVDGGVLPLLGQMSDGADGLEYLKNVLDACKSANIEGNPRIQYAYATGWRDLN